MKNKIIVLSLLLSLIFPPAFAQSKHIRSYAETQMLAQRIYQQKPLIENQSTSFYCKCTIRWHNKKGLPNLQKCGYQIRRHQTRANMIEWGLVVTAWQLGNQRACWQAGGRKKCRRTDLKFKQMEVDLHNFVPMIGEINSDRANFYFSSWSGPEGTSYGQCDMKVDFKNRLVDPPTATRGQIARIYKYMQHKYDFQLTKVQNQMIDAWDNMYPVDAWECERDRRIAQIQGNHNPFVAEDCQTHHL